MFVMHWKNIAFAVCLLPGISACHARPFQPSPAESTQWLKAGSSENEAFQSMLACGYINGSGTDAKATTEQRAERFQCMKRVGYSRRDGLDLCAQRSFHALKACAPAH
jgi:hypothetical protein